MAKKETEINVEVIKGESGCIWQNIDDKEEKIPELR